MNCHMARGYDLSKLVHELTEEVNGIGTTIEQSYHYVIDQGAMGWLKQSNQEDFVALFSSMPMEEIAEAILHRLSKTSYDQESIDILALGAGQAREEIRLIQILQKHSSIRNIRVFLLDISPFLLNAAYQRAQEIFSGDTNVQINGIYGNFHHLQRYHNLLSTSSRANRMLVVTMLGGTWTNLENELLLLRSGLRALPSNTIFLMDVVERYGSLNEANTIYANDPRLAGTSKWQKESKEFLSSPLLSYRQGAREQEIEWEFVLDDYNPYIPNSYVVEVRAHLKPNVQFTVRKFKRYQQEGLRDAFERHQWKLFRTFPFKRNMRAYLFQKQ